jgi:1-acyl-sn-glycerol-3-phosphate acyltransferase
MERIFAKTVSEVHGLEHLPQQGSFLLAANHVDFLDGFFINAALANANRRMRLRYITKTRNYWWLPGVTFPLSNRNGVIVPRAARALAKGDVVVNFPEAQRNTTDTLKPGKRGTARLALMTGVPIVPCGLIGPGCPSLRQSLETYFWRGLQMNVSFGRPILVEKTDHPTDGQIDELTRKIMDAIARLAKKHPPVLG